jgi:hypothetical protein
VGFVDLWIIFTVENFHRVGKCVVRRSALKMYWKNKISFSGRFLRISEVIET